MASTPANPCISATLGFYPGFEHLQYNTITLGGSPRVTQDFQENMYGHRSGIQTPSSGGGSVVTGPGGTAGLQTTGQAYTPASWPAPNNTVALPRVAAGMGGGYVDQLDFRYNPESA